MGKLVVVKLLAEYIVREEDVEKAKEALRRDAGAGIIEFEVEDVPERYQDWEVDEL